MEDPVNEISEVIRKLVASNPSVQQETVRKYFTPDCTLIHPFVRTPSYHGSRVLVEYIYRWYLIMSPHTELYIKSIAFDELNRLLYVSLHQTFKIQFLPFHRSEVNLTTVLSLTSLPSGCRADSNGLAASSTDLSDQDGHQRNKMYYISRQNDLYQTDEFIKFVLPWCKIGEFSVMAWQLAATLSCMVLAVLFQPLTWLSWSHSM